MVDIDCEEKHDDIIIKILKIVNNLPDLNQGNVIEKIKDESKAQYRSKLESYSHSHYWGVYSSLQEVKSNIESPLGYCSCGKTLLHYAANGGCEKIADALIKKGADVNAKDIYGNTSLHFAAKKGHLNTVNALLEGKADVDVKEDICKYTPLHLAAQNGHLHTLNALIEKGADVDAESSWFQYTPLHFAAENGHLDIVNALIEKRAYAYAARWSGRTPLDLAMKNGHWDVVNALVEKERSNSLENKTGNPRYYRDIVRKVQEERAFNKGIFVGGGVALASAIIVTALFATGVVAVGVLTILAAVSIVAVAGLAVGKVTYLISKPKTEVHEAKTDQQETGLKV